MGRPDLADLTWPEAARTCADSVLAVPLGATEQHGPHMTLTVDTEIASELCDRLAAVRQIVTTAPPIPYGSSGEHAGFPGTLSIGQAAVELVLLELVRSADAFAGTLLVSTHGGNAEPVARAVRRLHGEGRRVLAWSPSGSPTDSHAGRTETSVMLALRRGAVYPLRAEPGNTRPLDEIIGTLREAGVAAVSPNGVLGDSTGASAEEGERILRSWTRSLTAALDSWTQGFGGPGDVRGR
jgi:mycofactocin system creatininase family protein